MRHSADHEYSRGNAFDDVAGKVVELAPKGWFDLSWPVFGMAALLTGLVFASTDTKDAEKAWERVQGMFARKQEIVVNDRVLVVTANADRELQVIATLSPRGFDPVLANCAKDVEQQMARHRDSIRMAVVDGSVPNAGAIVQNLKWSLPARRVVLLQANSPRESIGPILLDRL